MTSPAIVRTGGMRVSGIEDLLRCPRTGQRMGRGGGAYVSEADPTVVFPIEAGILRAFVPHEPIAGDFTQVIKAFYEETPFPNYEGTDDVGSLIHNRQAPGFPEVLNRAIRPEGQVVG